MSLARRAGVAGVMATALAASLFTVAGPTSAARRTPVEVTPSTLPVSATPMLAWYRAAGQEIVRPGRQPLVITSRSPKGPSSGVRLLNARNGWLRADPSGRTSFVGADGRTVWRGSRPTYTSTPYGQVVATGGRTFVELVEHLTRGGRFSGTTVRVLRTRDGKVLRSRTFPHTQIRARAVTSSVVALEMSYPRAGKAVFATKYWTPRTGRLRVIRTSAEPGSPMGIDGPAATSLSHHLVGAGGTIRDSRTGRVLLRLGDEFPASLSPDGTRVVTFADFRYNAGYPEVTPHLMRIRDLRTGTVLATYHGLFSLDEQQGPFWESDSKVLIIAYDAIEWDESVDEEVPTGTAWIRCTTAGSCTRVPIDASADYVTIPGSR